MTTTRNHPGLADRTALARRGSTARIRAAGERVNDRIHATADERARARDWEVTQTPGRLGPSGRSYRDPGFAARRRPLEDTPAGRDERHE